MGERENQKKEKKCQEIVNVRMPNKWKKIQKDIPFDNEELELQENDEKNKSKINKMYMDIIHFNG